MAIVAHAPAPEEDAPSEDLENLTQPAVTVVALVTEALLATPPRVPEPPIDLALVARVFAPYGPLLSRRGKVEVRWMPGPDTAVVSVVPGDVSAERVTRLAARLTPALMATATPKRVERLSLHDSAGVIVLTPLDGSILAAASGRPGAAALLEILSMRAVPGRGGRPADAVTPAARIDVEVTGAHPIPVETVSARFDVCAPGNVPAFVIGEFAGHLISAIADDGAGLGTLHSLSVIIDTQRLVIHPVYPAARPPRFVAVVGGPEPSGLLRRRAEHVARALREAS